MRETSIVSALSPYHSPEVENTAENFLRYVAADGCARAAVGIDLLPARAEDGSTDERAELVWLLNCMRTIAAHDLYVVLSALQELDQAKADEVADRLVAAAEAGDSYGEWLWQWCTERGLDADAITAEAVQSIAHSEED